MTPVLWRCSALPLLAAGDLAAEPGMPAGANQAPADLGRAGLRVTQSTPKAGRAGQTCSAPPGVWVPPLGLSRLRGPFPWPGDPPGGEG